MDPGVIQPAKHANEDVNGPAFRYIPEGVNGNRHNANSVRRRFLGKAGFDLQGPTEMKRLTTVAQACYGCLM